MDSLPDPTFSFQRLATARCYHGTLLIPGRGTTQERPPPPLPGQITPVVTASLYKGFKKQLPGAPPATSTQVVCLQITPTSEGQGPGIPPPPLRSKQTCTTLIYASFQPILLGAARNKHNSTLPHTRKKK